MSAVAAAAAGAGEEFDFVAELKLEPSPAVSSGWVVTEFTAQRSIAQFPDAHYESKELRFLGKICDKLNLLGLSSPVELNRLHEAIQAVDPTREWLPLGGFTPREGYQSVLLHYRNRRSTFTINVHVQGERADLPSTPVSIQAEPPVDAGYRATLLLDQAALRSGVTAVALAALRIAERNALVPNGAPGNTAKIREELENTFLLDVPGTAPDFRVEVTEGRATGLTVQPVFIPKQITIELVNWAEEEGKYDKLIAAKLREKRVQRENEIRVESAGFLRDGSLVTRAAMTEWLKDGPGKKYALTPLRYEQDTLVLGAVDYISRNEHVATLGASYGATDGLQGTGSYVFIHDRGTHLDLKLDASYGAEADSTAAALHWSPSKPVSGWKLNADGSAEVRRNNAAHFGEAAAGDSVRWKKWLGSAGLSASRSSLEAEPVVGQWQSALSVALHLIHTDDQLTSSASLPVNADLPDSSIELKMSWSTKTLLTGGKTDLQFGAQLRLAGALSGLAGRYDYELAEGKLSASVVTGAETHRRWKASATMRAGRISGTAPLGGQFRAGGDDGWIRGLHEGELTGGSYWAQSLAAGPEVSSLFGGDGKSTGRPPAYLLAFYDFGRVENLAGTWQSAQGFGVALNLEDMPLGDGLTAALSLGYAYSPDSVVDRHGTVFVRIELPFTN